MTWPELPPSYFVTTVAGATLLVDRGTGRSARLDSIAALVIQHRESFADRDDAAAAMAELFERPQSEVDAGLADFDRDLAVVAQSAPPWEAPTYAPVQLPDSAPAATWTFDALGQSMHVTCHEEVLVPIVTSIVAAYPPSSGPVEHRFDIWETVASSSLRTAGSCTTGSAARTASPVWTPSSPWRRLRRAPGLGARPRRRSRGCGRRRRGPHRPHEPGQELDDGRAARRRLVVSLRRSGARRAGDTARVRAAASDRSRGSDAPPSPRASS